MAILGYVRTLSDEESRVFDRHSQALTAVGCERVFGDRSSGSADERPSLTTCLAALRSGDVLVVVQLDHLGYRMEALIRFVSDLADRCVGFRTLDTVFDTTTPAGRAFLQIQSALAEMERTLIRQRISGGIAAARARGRKGGRPRVMTDGCAMPSGSWQTQAAAFPRFATSSMASRSARFTTTSALTGP